MAEKPRKTRGPQNPSLTPQQHHMACFLITLYLSSDMHFADIYAFVKAVLLAFSILTDQTKLRPSDSEISLSHTQPQSQRWIASDSEIWSDLYPLNHQTTDEQYKTVYSHSKHIWNRTIATFFFFMNASFIATTSASLRPPVSGFYWKPKLPN